MVILSVVASLWFLVQGIKYCFILMDRFRLKRHRIDPLTGRFLEAAPRYHCSKDSKHGVLLLHGYGDTPKVYEKLIEHLQEMGVTYYAPLLSGHGYLSKKPMEGVSDQQWIQDALDAYGILGETCDEISVVGHSNGGTLAAVLASLRKVSTLVLVAPNLNPAPQDKLFKKLILNPLSFWVLARLYPYFYQFRSPLNNKSGLRTLLVYGVFPTKSLRALWGLQEKVDLTKMTYKKLCLLNPKEDVLVDTEENLKQFRDAHLNPEILIYEKSNHAILQDYDGDKIAKDIADILNTQVHP